MSVNRHHSTSFSASSTIDIEAQVKWERLGQELPKEVY